MLGVGVVIRKEMRLRGEKKVEANQGVRDLDRAKAETWKSRPRCAHADRRRDRGLTFDNALTATGAGYALVWPYSDVERHCSSRRAHSDFYNTLFYRR